MAVGRRIIGYPTKHSTSLTDNLGTYTKVVHTRVLPRMAKSKIELPRLQADFDSRIESVFSHSELVSLLTSGRFQWNLPRNMGPDAFIDMLLRRTKMTEVT